MSTNPTPKAPRLPDGMRLLSHEDMRAVHDAVRTLARQHGVTSEAADEISYAALAAAGVFVQPPRPEPTRCTAMFLPHERGNDSPDMLGVWQQCDDDPGHDPDEPHTGDYEWRDSDPGSVPARPAGEA